MKTFLSLLQFFPYVLQGVVAVEGVATTETGAAKKQIVMDSILGAAKVGETVPSATVALFSGLIDTVVSALNASGIFKHKSAAAPAAPAAPATT